MKLQPHCFTISIFLQNLLRSILTPAKNDQISAKPPPLKHLWWGLKTRGEQTKDHDPVGSRLYLVGETMVKDPI